MKEIKLLKLKVDNCYNSDALNDVEIVMGTEMKTATTIRVPVTEELLGRLLDILMPEATQAISDMFESLTGVIEEEIETPIEEVPFLSTENALDEHLIDTRDL